MAGRSSGFATGSVHACLSAVLLSACHWLGGTSLKLAETAMLPDLWRAADQRSGRGQRRTRVLVAGRISGAVLAAAGGAISLGDAGSQITPWIIAAGFTLAAVCELLGLTLRPEAAWYDCRALAESVKSASWRYAVGSDPFPCSMDGDEAARLYVRRCSESIDGLRRVDRAGWPRAAVTTQMQELRASAFEVRRRAYISSRTEVQRAWYSRKASWNRHWALGLRCALLAGEGAAVVWAVTRISTGWPSDVAGLMGALIAAGAAWLGFRQYDDRSAAYALADRELQRQLDELPHASEVRWSKVAAAAEEAISREHSMWVSSRQRLPWEAGEL